MLPNDKQREALCDMMYWAFLETRILGWSGRAAQAADLADAFHNLPKEVYGGALDPVIFREVLLNYQGKHGRQADVPGQYHYVGMLDAIFQPLVLYSRGRPNGRCLILAKLLCEVTGRHDAIATAERLFDFQHRPENP